MPVDVLLPLCIRFAGKETSTAQVSMVSTERDHVFEEPEQPLILLHQFPIEPADLVILAISVVVSLLRPPGFISAHEHRNAPREEQNRRKVLDLPLAQRLNVSIVRCSPAPPFHLRLSFEPSLFILPVALMCFFFQGIQAVKA